MQRLRRIRQLGLTHLVYPGALHTRFHHVLGAMHLMNLAIQVIRRKGHEITNDEEEAVLAAILLHDIGHGPFSHALEHTIVSGVSHEAISDFFMKRLEQEFGVKLHMAREIFSNTYKKPFLYQLVSSQLDMDRMDYLNRDSFYTGVSEGIIGSDRIIEMLNVHNGELVLEEKGIYSVEKFITARRLMYWQVYLHKTVLCVEQMLIKAVERAKYLIENDITLPCSEALDFFLKNKITLHDFETNSQAIQHFADLDDVDVFAALKSWKNSSDNVLSFLCSSILNRHLFKIEITKEPFTESEITKLKEKAAAYFKLPQEEAKWLIFQDSTYNHAYNAKQGTIKIIDQQGNVQNAENISQHLETTVLSEKVVKYFVCYPKALSTI